MVCATEVVVVRGGVDDIEITCGGQPLVPLDASTSDPPAAPVAGEGTQLGKRYSNDARGIELLCTRAGEGALATNGTELSLKGAKPLPSSD